ncbi:hypothetical protein [Helicobacter cinaedi]|uniref:hypothetical protein n=1 Tax=Helicobacter cinaedi TaxID=213 RepID=UPI000D7CE1AE|nr:hypothetical protein [Helicobacter cinaedi]BBB18851.1 hypothetical protein HC081234_00280 [Helicobacter cinaedi]
MTKQELEEELETRQWRPKQVYTPQAKKSISTNYKSQKLQEKTQQKAQVKAHLNPAKMPHATKKEA